MRPLIVLIALFLAAASTSAGGLPAPPDPFQIGYTLSGVITDSATGQPLAGVSVFLNNTSRGTTTAADGIFHLEIPRGTYTLIISAVSYETATFTVNGSRPSANLRVILRPRAAELESVTVEPYEKNGWARYGKFFWDNFMGTVPNAGQCEIKNKEVLRFHFYKRNNWLTVTATEPLIIENNALGYVLKYRLERFTFDFQTKTISYYGYPFFQEMQTTKHDKQEKWIENRRLAYTGSFMHFIRSLYAGNSIRQGFIAQTPMTIPNDEKTRIQSIYHPDFQKLGSFPLDTLHYFWDVLRQPATLHVNAMISPDSLVTTTPEREKSFFFVGPLRVSYGVNSRDGAFRSSELRFISATGVTIEENGNYYPPQDILFNGYWGFSEKIANLLPLDYQL